MKRLLFPTLLAVAVFALFVPTAPAQDEPARAPAPAPTPAPTPAPAPFEAARQSRDRDAVRRLLLEVHVEEASIQTILEQL